MHHHEGEVSFFSLLTVNKTTEGPSRAWAIALGPGPGGLSKGSWQNAKLSAALEKVSQHRNMVPLACALVWVE